MEKNSTEPSTSPDKKEKPSFTFNPHEPAFKAGAAGLAGVIFAVHAHPPGDYPTPPWSPPEHIEFNTSSSAIVSGSTAIFTTQRSS